MPVMSGVERRFCRSAPWQWWTRRVALPWVFRGVHLSGDVLEIGGGAGSMAASTSARFPGLSLTVTDADPAMVAASRSRLSGAPHIDVREADATRLPFGDASFDWVLSHLMLHHVVDWPAALTEAHRVLRPGGRLLGYDITATPLARAVHWVDRSPHQLLSPELLEAGLVDAGLTVDHVRTSGVGHVMRFAARRS